MTRLPTQPIFGNSVGVPDQPLPTPDLGVAAVQRGLKQLGGVLEELQAKQIDADNKIEIIKRSSELNKLMSEQMAIATQLGPENEVEHFNGFIESLRAELGKIKNTQVKIGLTRNFEENAARFQRGQITGRAKRTIDKAEVVLDKSESDLSQSVSSGGLSYDDALAQYTKDVGGLSALFDEDTLNDKMFAARDRFAQAEILRLAEISANDANIALDKFSFLPLGTQRALRNFIHGRAGVLFNRAVRGILKDSVVDGVFDGELFSDSFESIIANIDDSGIDNPESFVLNNGLGPLIDLAESTNDLDMLLVLEPAAKELGTRAITKLNESRTSIEKSLNSQVSSDKIANQNLKTVINGGEPSENRVINNLTYSNAQKAGTGAAKVYVQSLARRGLTLPDELRASFRNDLSNGNMGGAADTLNTLVQAGGFGRNTAEKLVQGDNLGIMTLRLTGTLEKGSPEYQAAISSLENKVARTAADDANLTLFGGPDKTKRKVLGQFEKIPSVDITNGSSALITEQYQNDYQALYQQKYLELYINPNDNILGDDGRVDRRKVSAVSEKFANDAISSRYESLNGGSRDYFHVVGAPFTEQDGAEIMGLNALESGFRKTPFVASDITFNVPFFLGIDAVDVRYDQQFDFRGAPILPAINRVTNMVDGFGVMNGGVLNIVTKDGVFLAGSEEPIKGIPGDPFKDLKDAYDSEQALRVRGEDAALFRQEQQSRDILDNPTSLAEARTRSFLLFERIYARKPVMDTNNGNTVSEGDSQKFFSIVNGILKTWDFDLIGQDK